MICSVWITKFSRWCLKSINKCIKKIEEYICLENKDSWLKTKRENNIKADLNLFQRKS